MFPSFGWLGLGCLFLAVESRTGHITPPRNITIRWITDFQPELTWEPSRHCGSSCSYTLSAEINDDTPQYEIENCTSASWSREFGIEGGLLNFNIKTVCGNETSEPAFFNASYPEMVKNLKCYIRSSKHSHCSWESASPTKDLGFFYRLTEDSLGENENDHASSAPLQECPSYSFTDDVRTGCDLQARTTDRISIVLNGTVNNKFVRNTFSRYFRNDVRPFRLEWTVNKTVDKFKISWIPPDIMTDLWKFRMNYTECNEIKGTDIIHETSAELDLVSHCHYCMNIKAVYEGFSSPPSEQKCFDADKDPNTLVYAAIILPLMSSGLAALVFVCYRKYKANIFPKVPQPRDLLSDISDNNNKSTVCNLYVPADEEESCKITLVTDPKSTNHTADTSLQW
ncbi:uncharacterized protein LOC120797091 [Xiphias gladius]|uniref:uncharacterized protein LOC120797091 n=1 Tax=Xiphias gladius TaxID=8245 RepID=UPI001A9906B2|nr:uncharacterized protein LOC120797091 [Xiphias gladius]